MQLTAPNSKLTRVRLSYRPAWLGDLLPEGLKYSTSFSKPERRTYRRRKKIAPSEWVELHRYVTHGRLAGHVTRLEESPHIATQLDASVMPSVRGMVICAAPQTGKSFMVDSAVQFRMDMDPGPALTIYPDRTTGEENCEERMQVAIRKSPRLAKLLPGGRDDMTKTCIKLNNMTYHVGWAGSAISTSNRSVKILDMQEVEKWPDAPNKKETGSIEMALIRVTAYPDDHIIFISSSPTIESGQVWQALLECDVVFEYWVRCPFCSHEQVMVFDEQSKNFRWPHGEDGHSLDRLVISREKLARYHCEKCDTPWEDMDRNRAIQSRTWRAKTEDGSKGMEAMAYIRRYRPQWLGWVQPSWISSFVSLSTVAADFLKTTDASSSRHERKKALRNFCNKHKAEPFFPQQELRAEDAILELCEDRPVSLVPGGGQVAGLFFYADTQDNGFWYAIAGIGYGPDPVWWMVQCGFVLSFEALAEVLWSNVYHDTDGCQYVMQFGLIDSMGHRTSEVYDFCRKYPGRIMPTKGERTMAEPYNFKKIEHYPDGRVFPYGLQRVRINTTHYKDKMDSRLQVNRADPGALRLYANFPRTYAAQLCAEVRDEQEVWVNPKERANHLWDCFVGIQVAADIKWVQNWPRPEEIRQQQQQQQQQQRKNGQRRERW
jgi:phage terminase large subunit GpA-like protein